MRNTTTIYRYSKQRSGEKQMKYLTISLVFLLAGCNTTVPVKMKFPTVPESFLMSCTELKQLQKDAKLSDVAKSVVENYTLYHECSIKNDAWIEWYKIQKKVFEDIK
jgi:hypothetical protein